MCLMHKNLKDNVQFFRKIMDYVVLVYEEVLSLNKFHFPFFLKNKLFVCYISLNNVLSCFIHFVLLIVCNYFFVADMIEGNIVKRIMEQNNGSSHLSSPLSNRDHDDSVLGSGKLDTIVNVSNDVETSPSWNIFLRWNFFLIMMTY